MEVKTADKVNVFKIKLSGLIKKQRPFDTSFHMMGSDLMNGEDVPETLRIFIRTYNLSVTCLDDRILLSGRINANRFKGYASKRRTGTNEKFNNRFIEQFKFIVIEFNPEIFI